MGKKDGKIEILCPACRSTLIIDADSGGIIKHIPPVKEKATFDSMLSSIQQKEKGLGDAFSSAFDKEKGRQSFLDKKFKQSMDDFEKYDDGAPPPKPFDF